MSQSEKKPGSIILLKRDGNFTAELHSNDRLPSPGSVVRTEDHQTSEVSVSNTFFNSSLAEFGSDRPFDQDSEEALFILRLPLFTPFRIQKVYIEHNLSSRRVASLFAHRHWDKDTKPYVYLRQSMYVADNPIWAMQLNSTRQLLATAGRDGVIRIWTVGSNAFSSPVTFESSPSTAPTITQASIYSEPQYNASSDTAAGDAAEAIGPLDEVSMCMPTCLSSPPLRQYVGHLNEILTLAWSTNNSFLASGSVDGTVRLWNTVKACCISVLRHSYPVLAVLFHPDLDDVLYTVTHNNKLRRWALSTGAVTCVTIREQVTCLSHVKTRAFKADTTLIAGTYDGTVLFFDHATLAVQAALSVHSTRGKLATPHAITGITVAPSQTEIFVSSSDSRVRGYSLSTLTQLCKCRGFVNTGEASQLSSSVVDLGEMAGPLQRLAGFNDTILRSRIHIVVFPDENGDVFMFDGAVLARPAQEAMSAAAPERFSQTNVARFKHSALAAYCRFKAFSCGCTCHCVIPKHSSSGVLGQGPVAGNSSFLLIVASNRGELKVFDV